MVQASRIVSKGEGGSLLNAQKLCQMPALQLEATLAAAAFFQADFALKGEPPFGGALLWELAFGIVAGRPPSRGSYV